LSDQLYEVWEWIVDEGVNTLKNKQAAFELTTKYFENKFGSNEIRQYLIKMGFFDNKE